mmetsp:Transcript_71717/g.226597  ORF Transcript_71717/g.226597 Transcript_71717/m.226597 type:complete len:217 (-) Transcript_71717:163-813(-)
MEPTVVLPVLWVLRNPIFLRGGWCGRGRGTPMLPSRTSSTRRMRARGSVMSAHSSWEMASTCITLERLGFAAGRSIAFALNRSSGRSTATDSGLGLGFLGFSGAGADAVPACALANLDKRPWPCPPRIRRSLNRSPSTYREVRDRPSLPKPRSARARSGTPWSFLALTRLDLVLKDGDGSAALADLKFQFLPCLACMARMVPVVLLSALAVLPVLE